MSIRTISVQRIVENIVLEKTGKSRDEFDSHIDMIKIAEKEIFDNYPIFDEELREQLNVKILSHYYFREIVIAPYQRWRFYINESMELNMPYYNKLYESSAKKYDIFDNVNYTEILDRDLTSKQLHKNIRELEDSLNVSDSNERILSDKITNEQNQETNSDGTLKRKYQDTPYTQLGQNDYATDITDENTYDNSTSINTGKQNQNTQMTDSGDKEELRNSLSTSNNDTTGTNTEDYTKTIKGKMGTRSMTDLLLEYRKSILNIDKMVIEMLNDNFSGYYN